MTRAHALFFVFVLAFIAVLGLGQSDSSCSDDEETPSDTSTVTSTGGSCVCGDEGVTLTPVSGCENWDDADQCSGWASVAGENGYEVDDPFEDGTELTGYGCTIRINCP